MVNRGIGVSLHETILDWPQVVALVGKVKPARMLQHVGTKRTESGPSLSESRVDAVRLALASRVLVLTGGPGLAKTTLINAILRILAAKDVNFLLCAPTGRAAKRLSEFT